ncbi:hypothetical protein TRFO_18910 [Tritrichomonas foetus]|uniref:C2 domain-containing protein n=1 Tax=Tritrichomonas foetus TaxID=1144522 RepID=A0A1J4KQ50_9EUKA|nr:hypothetical protein TRFO_18910 [Tritrichomonas foetus]|eukprot:OHT11557.1 hypothetical protein TRFO_18910 [Tritrichomonas foetus]
MTLLREKALFIPPINLHVWATGLKKMDFLSKSDPVCALYTKNKYVDESDPKHWTRFAQTEIIWNDLDPVWQTYFTVVCAPQDENDPVEIKLAIYDVDKDSSYIHEEKIIGEALFSLKELNLSTDVTTKEIFKPGKPKPRGSIHVCVDKPGMSSETVEIQLKIKKLSAKKPFYIISKLSRNNKFINVYRSKFGSDKCTWGTTIIGINALCDSNPDHKLKFTFFNAKSDTTFEQIGFFCTSLNELIASKSKFKDIQNEKEKKVGSIQIFDVVKRNIPDIYQQFSQETMILNLVSAVDFTGSNKPQKNPESLHKVDSSNPKKNSYQQCLENFVCLFRHTQYKQQYPAVGFGAIYQNKVSHCFPLSLKTDSIFFKNETDFMNGYIYAALHLDYTGPSYFSGTIKYGIKFAQDNFAKNKAYTVLLMIVDGNMEDIIQTTNEIVRIANENVPLSIFIIGVGPGDFSEMKKFENCENLVSTENKTKAKRDVIHFCRFNELDGVDLPFYAAKMTTELNKQFLTWKTSS